MSRTTVEQQRTLFKTAALIRKHKNYEGISDHLKEPCRIVDIASLIWVQENIQLNMWHLCVCSHPRCAGIQLGTLSLLTVVSQTHLHVWWLAASVRLHSQLNRDFWSNRTKGYRMHRAESQFKIERKRNKEKKRKHPFLPFKPAGWQSERPPPPSQDRTKLTMAIKNSAITAPMIDT